MQDGGSLLCAIDEGNDHNISVWDWQKNEKGHKITETKVSCGINQYYRIISHNRSTLRQFSLFLIHSFVVLATLLHTVTRQPNFLQCNYIGNVSGVANMWLSGQSCTALDTTELKVKLIINKHFSKVKSHFLMCTYLNNNDVLCCVKTSFYLLQHEKCVFILLTSLNNAARFK